MYGNHHSFRIDPAFAERFLEWQSSQWDLIRSSDGFDNGSLTRGIVDRDQFFAIALWETEDAFRRIKARGWLTPPDGPGVTVYEADEAAGSFDDVVGDSTPDMIGTQVAYVTVPGTAETFIHWKTHEGVLQRAAPGFIKRSMARSVTDPRVFYYHTYWKDVASIDAFVNSAAFKSTNDSSNITSVIEPPKPVRIHELLCFRK